LGGIKLNDKAFKTIKSYGMRKGIETIGELRHGLSKLARSNQLVILCYFYCSNIGTISLLFYFSSFSFLLSHKAMM
jgi:hypothetical protein